MPSPIPPKLFHEFAPVILRKYDIRGTIGRNLSEEDAYYLGLSYGTYAHNHNHQGAVCIGYDGRVSSPHLAQALSKGLNEAGYSTVQLGLVATPVLYFATYAIRGAIGGIMITGSHNPPNENGFKMVLEGSPLFDQSILELANIAAAGQFYRPQGNPANHSHDIMAEYAKKLVQANNISQNKALKIAWDPGNGAVAAVLPTLLQVLPGQHIVINGTVDGTFPAHHPDPSVPSNLEQLRAVVLKEHCDLGFAFDGDGDRLGVVDNHGAIVSGDHLLMLLAQDLLSRHPNAKIIADIKTSNMVLAKITEWGGRPCLWKTGHSFIKTKMREEQALLAGEMSGHLFFAENYYGFDDAIFAAIRMMGILSATAFLLSELVQQLPTMINTPEIRIDCTEERKFVIIDELKSHLNSVGIAYSDLDGVRVENKNGWWLIRPSNTQSCLVMRAEGKDATSLQETLAQAQQFLKTCGIVVSV